MHVSTASLFDFYPRPPGGGRRVWQEKKANCFSFLSTPSGWRATVADPDTGKYSIISIHALRVEGDLDDVLVVCAREAFLSTPSGWRATVLGFVGIAAAVISIHALRVEGDLVDARGLRIISISIHALRVEGDPRFPAHDRRGKNFYPRPPGGGRLASLFMGGGVG